MPWEYYANKSESIPGRKGFSKQFLSKYCTHMNWTQQGPIVNNLTSLLNSTCTLHKHTNLQKKILYAGTCLKRKLQKPTYIHNLFLVTKPCHTIQVLG